MLTKRAFATIALALLGIAGFVYLFGGTAPVRNADSDGKDIIAFGDSLVAGVGSTEGNDFVSLLSRRTGRTIVNLGKSGDTTASALERIGEIARYDPKVVILLLGGNDFLRGRPKAETFEDLGKIIEALQNEGAAVILLGVRGGILSDGYGESFEELACRYETAFVPDVLEGLIGNPELMSDTIHPNDQGYAVIADRVAPELMSLINR